jgi:DNA-binding NarL/FixJ family response regulator
VTATTVAIVADDLIWATRLADTVTSLDLTPRRVRRLADLEVQLGEGVRLVIVDLTAIAYDGVEAVQTAAATGARVLAVGQHDDLALRRRALDAGAERVLPYRKLFEAGPATLRAWLAAPAPTKATR